MPLAGSAAEAVLCQVEATLLLEQLWYLGGDPAARGSGGGCCKARRSSFSWDPANFPSPLLGSTHFC